MRSVKYILLLILLVSCCHAGLIDKGHNYCNSGSSTSCTVTLGWSPAAGNTLMVLCINYGTSTGLPTVSDSGSHSYAQLSTGNGLTALGIPTMFDYHNIAAGVATVTCTWGTGDYIQTYVAEFSGNLAFNAAATTLVVLGAATQTSNAVTALSGDLMIGFAGVGGISTMTPNGGVYTLIDNITDGLSGGWVYLQLGSAGSKTVTFNNSGTQNSILGLVAFTPPGGASNSATPSHGVTME